MRDGTLIFGIVVASIDRPSEGSGTNPIMPEPSFYRSLSLAAKPLGIDLYVFAADGFQTISSELHAYRFEHDKWVKQLVPLPDIVYDRCFHTSASVRASCNTMLAAIKHSKPFVMLNGTLPSKLDVYDALIDDGRLAPYLPVTIRYQSAQQLTQLAQLHQGGIILKPSAGMQGRGLAHIKHGLLEGSTRVSGRTRSNRTFSISLSDQSALQRWLNRFTRQSVYLIQPYLELTGMDDVPFDVRALLQKDGKGSWSLSGTAVRCGKPGSLTSNLHGGGDAHPASELLLTKLGPLKAERLLEQIHTISGQTAERLESKFGRFAELGLDFGIEPDGRLWLIEANSKPGRSSFRRINDKDAERHSIERPLLYARLLSRRLYPSFAANESANGRLRYSSIDNPLRPFNVQEVHR